MGPFVLTVELENKMPEGEFMTESRLKKNIKVKVAETRRRRAWKIEDGGRKRTGRLK